jgi:hydrogenase maturation protease
MSATPGGILVVGYGNELRGDDGVGPHVAREIERRELPGVRTLVLHQLTPELAAEIAEADGVIFVDAQQVETENEIAVSELRPAEAPSVMSHACNPQCLLAMAQLLYERAPAAWLVAVPGHSFEIGSGISSPTAMRADRAVEQIQQLILLLDART